MKTITRRIVAAVAGPAIATGFIAAGIAAGTPAQAKADTMRPSTCTTSMLKKAPTASVNALTRAGQVSGVGSTGHSSPGATSCIAR